MSEQMKVTRDVDASPEQVFAVLSDPSRHMVFDGADMLRGLAEGGPITGVGDAFVMNMENRILGDYQVRNEVSAYEENRKLGWLPVLYPKGAYTDKIGDMDPGGHSYTWELEPNSSGGTTVTQTYDWSGVWDAGFKSRFPMLNEDILAASIDKVGKAAAGVTDGAPDSVAISGAVAPGFEPVRDVFAANFARWGEVGATCCVYVDGRPAVDLTGGQITPASDVPYRADTLQMVASATKGALAIVALRLAERGALDLDAPVASYWPEFAAAGKADVPVRWLLSHRTGLPKVDAPLTLGQLLEWAPLVDALAAQAPVWAPGTDHGYHALTYGSLVGEVLARATGQSPGELIRKEIAEPLGIEFWVGLPAELIGQVAPMLRSIRDPGDKPDPLMLQLADSTSLAYGAFFMDTEFMTSMNDPALWQAQIPAANGFSNARSLARMYAACLGEVDGVRLISPETLRAAVTPQSEGIDRVLTYETRFGLGFQLPSASRPMSGPNCFGHYGLGGSTGFADLDRDFTFGYVVNQMRSASTPDPRSSALIEALLACL